MQNTFLAIFVVLALAFGSAAVPTPADAAQAPTPAEQPPLLKEESASPSPETRVEALRGLLERIEQQGEEIEAKREAMREASSETEREQLEAELNRLIENNRTLRNNFLRLLTGISRDAYVETPKEEVGIFEELEAIFRPLLSKLRDFTSRSREVERLRTQIALKEELEDRVAEGLARAQSVRENAEDEELVEAIRVAEEDMQERLEELRQDRLIYEEQFKDLQRVDGGIFASAKELAGDVLSFHLRNLMLTLLVISVTYFLLRLIYARLMLSRRSQRMLQRHHWLRILNVILRSMVVIFALGAGLLVLYLSNDWILIGLFILVVLGFIWSMKDNIPQHLIQLQLLLNIGAVRESERIIYRGLPWRVEPINYYTSLVNPALEGGRVRVALGDLVGLTSRPMSRREPWFPTRTHDWVILADATYGQVKLQTPDAVVVRIMGGSEKTYTTLAFLDQHPVNLSRGFAIYFLFGVDYAHQAAVTEEIPTMLKAAIEDGFAKAGLSHVLKSMFVEFSEAGASSLDMAVFAEFDSDAADSYYKLRRLLRRIAVDACTANGWVIPFTQITVHAADEAEVADDEEPAERRLDGDEFASDRS
jgi:hypothetical protein